MLFSDSGCYVVFLLLQFQHTQLTCHLVSPTNLIGTLISEASNSFWKSCSSQLRGFDLGGLPWSNFCSQLSSVISEISAPALEGLCSASSCCIVTVPHWSIRVARSMCHVTLTHRDVSYGISAASWVSELSLRCEQESWERGRNQTICLKVSFVTALIPFQFSVVAANLPLAFLLPVFIQSSVEFLPVWALS